MSSSPRSGGLEFEMRFRSGADAAPVSDVPFRILVMGDFSGRQSRGELGLPAGSRTVAFDCDNLDTLPAKLGTAVRLDLGAADAVTLTFGELDDLHPDSIFDQVGLFSQLRDLRGRLLNPSTFASAADELKRMLGPLPAGEDVTPAAAAQTGRAQAEPADDFARLLGGKAPAAPGAPAPVRDKSLVAGLIRDLIASHIVSAPDPRQDQMVAALDEAIAGQMRAILHHPHYAAVETAWRSAELMMQNIETDEDLQLHLLDYSRADLLADCAADRPIEETELYRLLVRDACEVPGAVPWTVVVGVYAFGTEDAELLQRLGVLAERGRTVFLSGFAFDPDRTAEDQLAGGAAWETLRRSGGPAGRLALSAPRVMMRLPYGRRTDPIDRFDFEEMPVGGEHENYLWGSSAVACACMLAQAYTRTGWGFDVSAVREFGGLPIHVYDVDGDSRMTPCAEYWLSDGDAEDLVVGGITAVQSIRGRDAVRVEHLVSLAGTVLKVGRS